MFDVVFDSVFDSVFMFVFDAVFVFGVDVLARIRLVCSASNYISVAFSMLR